MPQINQNSLVAIQPELTPGESILWAGQPNRGVVFHKQDFFLVPFSLLWGGFAMFWEAGVAGLWGANRQSADRWVLGMIWGIPFVLIGQYFIWGRFLYSAWKKKRTHYGVTDRRVVVVQEGWGGQMASAYIDVLPIVVKESSAKGIGTLRFTQPDPSRQWRGTWGGWDVMTTGTVPVFVDIDDVDSVYRLVADLREKTRATVSGER